MKIQQYTTPVILAGAIILASCQSEAKIESSASRIPGYDSLKAQEYGADDYGMRKYVMAFLRRGPNKDLSAEQRNELQAAHLKNIHAMGDAGKLVLAGPFFGNDDLRGIYVFNVASIEEAEELTNTDPAIQAGILEMDLKEWYGSAALLAVNEIHETIAKKSF